MPLHGKIVVIKRSGADGTEFPLTATCLFGRKPDCDIRIQLPQVSKEHCRIDLNENKEVTLTNLSSTCPTRVNGETLRQSERLKHGDLITIVDRSFRFEYPPAPTPKKRSSSVGKTETLKVLQDQQVGDTIVAEKGERKISEVSTGPHLKDGANHNNIQRSLDNTAVVDSMDDGSQLQSKTISPFSDLYQMIKKSMDVKTPRKSSVSQIQTPSSRFCTPKPNSVRKNNQKCVTPKKDEAKVITDPEGSSIECPQSAKKQEDPFHVPSTVVVGPRVIEAESTTKSQASLQMETNGATPQRFTVSEVIEQISAQSPKVSVRRRSKEVTPAKPAVTQEQEQQAMTSPKTERPVRTSPRNLGKAEKVKEVSEKRKSGELGHDLLTPQRKKKRVSFGGFLSPELFDKRLPPDSPLQKGAAPRRSLSLLRPKQSLLRRASVIGLLKEEKRAKERTPSPKKSLSHKSATPEIQSGKKVPKSKSPSPKRASPAKNAPQSRASSPKAASTIRSPKVASPVVKTPKSRSASPKAASPAVKTPKSRSSSPKAASPAVKTPKSRSSSPKAASPAVKTPRSRSSSPKAASPAVKTPRSRSSSPKAASPVVKTPKSRSASPKAASPAVKTPKSRSSSPKAASPAVKTPKSRSSSPKAASPAVKTPRSRSSSPKAASPVVKTPKSRSASPKAASPAVKTPRSRSSSPKAASPAVKTPKSRSSSPKAASPGQKTPRSRSSLEMSSDASLIGVTPAKTPLNSGVQTPTVQGRFSVSRISTPSPTGEIDTVPDQEPLVNVTPKMHLKRKSIKNASQKTPSAAKSATKMQRRSCISRASMKCSWADKVRFGQAKVQVVAPTKKIINQNTTKKAVPKPQTPARKFKDHTSTGHAESPVTIVVGRAHRRMVAYPTGAAPRMVTNTALLKKDMKMDEDLTGISEMFKTPVNEQKRRSLINQGSTAKTPTESITSVMEPVLNTPEEPGEMMVSPLNVASTVKTGRYNTEAVQRLLVDEESSLVSDTHDLEVQSESSEQLYMDLKTPEQKKELPEYLTGVKRILRTPRQKAEPLEDIRGRLLKTPKQKPEQQECLTGVKRMMKTPKQKAEPLEDIRGKLLVTPKQKPEQQEGLTGVKRIFKTPKQKAEPIEDLRGKLLKTPKVQIAGDVSLDGVKELLETPTCMQKSNVSEIPDMKDENTKITPMICVTGIKRVMKTPKEKNSPVEDMVGVKRLMRTPREKGEPVEENFGIQRLMKSPKLRDNAPVEDFDGLKELMEEPLPDPTVQLETNKEEVQMPVDRDVNEAKAPDANEVGADKHSVVASGFNNNEALDTMEILSHGDADDSEPQQQLEVDQNSPEVETPNSVTEMNTAVKISSHEEKSVRGRRGKKVESKEASEPSEQLVANLPVRGRRGKNTEVVAPPAVRNTRGRNVGNTEVRSVEATVEESAPKPSKAAVKPKRGRNAKKAPDSEAEMVQEVGTEIEMAPEPESEQSPAANVEHTANGRTVSVEKPKRVRKAKQPEQSQQQDVPCPQPEDVPQADIRKETSCDQPEASPGETNGNESSEADKSVHQTAEAENLPDVETTACKAAEINTAVVLKKPVRGRRVKLVESKETDDKQEAADVIDEPVVLAPVRGRRGKKIEATAPPAVKPTRTRKAKSQETTPDQPACETPLITEISTETVALQAAVINTSQEKEKNDSAPQAEEVVSKSLRGRRNKPTSVESTRHQAEKTEAVSSDHNVANTQPEPQEPIPPAVGKPKRGRKTKPDTVEQIEVIDETSLAVETKQESQPPARAKRGRNAKLEEEEKLGDVETNSQEPVKKLRRTRKPEQDHVEGQSIEIIAPEKAETELVPINDQVGVAAKPKRGGRKAKPDTDNLPAVAAEPKEPLSGATDKPKHGRRGRQVTEDAATTENTECNLVIEEQKKSEPSVENIKPSRAKALKTAVKNDISQSVPAKRSRRGAALSLETPEETTALVEESVPAPVKAAKGRPAGKPTAHVDMVSSDQTNLSEDLSKTTTEEMKRSKRSVKWKSDVEVFDIPKETPVKPVQGRKSKPTNKVDLKNVSKDANKTEEEDLSDKVAKAQPVKRGRRGAKDADVTAESTSKGDLKSAEDEPQPKTRRGRSAKK